MNFTNFLLGILLVCILALFHSMSIVQNVSAPCASSLDYAYVNVDAKRGLELTVVKNNEVIAHRELDEFSDVYEISFSSVENAVVATGTNIADENALYFLNLETQEGFTFTLDGFFGHVELSPFGDKIYYVSSFDTGVIAYQNYLNVFDVASKTSSQLAINGQKLPDHIELSPDGNVLLYTDNSSSGVGRSVYALDTQSLALREIGTGTMPTFMEPDGEDFFWYENTETGQTFFMGKDGLPFLDYPLGRTVHTSVKINSKLNVFLIKLSIFDGPSIDGSSIVTSFTIHESGEAELTSRQYSENYPIRDMFILGEQEFATVIEVADGQHEVWIFPELFESSPCTFSATRVTFRTYQGPRMN